MIVSSVAANDVKDWSLSIWSKCAMDTQGQIPARHKEDTSDRVFSPAWTVLEMMSFWKIMCRWDSVNQNHWMISTLMFCGSIYLPFFPHMKIWLSVLSAHLCWIYIILFFILTLWWAPRIQGKCIIKGAVYWAAEFLLTCR